MDNMAKIVIGGLAVLVLSKAGSRGAAAADLPPAHDPGQPEINYETMTFAQVQAAQYRAGIPMETIAPVPAQIGSEGQSPYTWTSPEGQVLVWDPDATLDANGYPTNGAGAWVVPGVTPQPIPQPEPDLVAEEMARGAFSSPPAQVQRTGPQGQVLTQDGFGRWGYIAGQWPNEYLVYV